MPYDIQGWVEVTAFDGSEQQDEYAWQSLLNLNTVIDVADSISERLFGLSKGCAAGADAGSAVAAGRGVPSNPSPEVQAKLQAIAAHERQYGRGEFGGYTHATWREVKGAQLEAEALGGSDWGLVFNLLRELEQDHRFSDDRIRLVVWACW